MEGFVFVTFCNTVDEVVSTHVVKEEKIDMFLDDKYALPGIGVAYVHNATECLNGSIGKSTYLFTRQIKH